MDNVNLRYRTCLATNYSSDQGEIRTFLILQFLVSLSSYQWSQRPGELSLKQLCSLSLRVSQSGLQAKYTYMCIIQIRAGKTLHKGIWVKELSSLTHVCEGFLRIFAPWHFRAELSTLSPVTSSVCPQAEKLPSEYGEHF